MTTVAVVTLNEPTAAHSRSRHGGLDDQISVGSLPRVGQVGRSILQLFTPSQYASLPGLPFPAPPDTYPGKDDVADYLELYAKQFHSADYRRSRDVLPGSVSAPQTPAAR